MIIERIVDIFALKVIDENNQFESFEWETYFETR